MKWNTQSICRKLSKSLFVLVLAYSFPTSFTFALARGGSSSSAASTSRKSVSSTVISSGLNNLGNTCYLNAQLQCAFHIPHIRDIIINSTEQKEENDTKSISIGLHALRHVFVSMLNNQNSNQPISTTRTLCQTLGINVFEQQDSQEFWKLLVPALQYPTLMDVYQGAFQDYIIAQDGSGRERRKEEPFLDLSLEVNSGSVFQSIKDTFTNPELLSNAEGNGWRPEKGADKVDALKGSELYVAGLPSVLQLHLKRFQYDWNTDTMSKINDPYIFPEELDLSTICTDIPKDEMSKYDANNSIYDLQSIVVHAGEYGSGHYYSYVRPNMLSKRWYRFDDHRVTEVDYFDDVIRDAFGGKHKTAQGDNQQSKDNNAKRGFWSKLFQRPRRKRDDDFGYGGKYGNAYMLQYVKRSCIPLLYNL